MSALKATVSDFEQKYKAYSVYTRDGAAYKGPNYGRDVDIAAGVSYALTTRGAQALYGDTVALQVRNERGGRPWPAEVTLYESPIKMVSLALSFNKLSKLKAEAAETGSDPVKEAFEKAAGKQHLMPLDHFFVIPSHALPEGTQEDETVTETTTEEAAKLLAKQPHNVILTAKGAGDLLKAAHESALLIEKQKAGFIGSNKFHLVGLYIGNSQPVSSLPIPIQDRAPISQITSELRRILG